MWRFTLRAACADVICASSEGGACEIAITASPPLRGPCAQAFCRAPTKAAAPSATEPTCLRVIMSGLLALIASSSRKCVVIVFHQDGDHVAALHPSGPGRHPQDSVPPVAQLDRRAVHILDKMQPSGQFSGAAGIARDVAGFEQTACRRK